VVLDTLILNAKTITMMTATVMIWVLASGAKPHGDDVIYLP
jgi:hypothetical protein